MNNNNQKNPQPRPVNPQQRPMGAQPAGPQPRPVNPQQRPMGAQPAGPQPRPVGPQPRPVNPQQRPMGAQPAGPQPRPVGPQPHPVNPQQRPMGTQPAGPQPRPVGPQPRPVNPQQRPMGAQPAGPQPRPVGPQPRPVNPQQRPVRPQARPVPLQNQNSNNDDSKILGSVGAVTGIAGAVIGGMALYKLTHQEQNESSNPVEEKNKRPNIGKKDRIASFHEEYYKTIEGKRIVVVDIINMDDWDRYSIKLEEILNLFHGYNPLQEYTYENISATLSAIRNDSMAVPGLPARVSEFLGIDKENNILIFKPYKSPEQPDFTFEQKQQILSERERIVEIKKKILGKNLYISNQGKTYVEDSTWGRAQKGAILDSGFNSLFGRGDKDYGAQKDILLHVLGSEGISSWLRGDEDSDVMESIKKLIRNFSLGDNYPILFDNHIALFPEKGEFIKLKENIKNEQ